MVSWKQYYAEHTKGKKFSGSEIREHMKKLAADYKKMKNTEGKGMEEEEVVVPPDASTVDSPVEMDDTSDMEEGGRAMPKKKVVRRIDFSKINWGAFTQDWKKMGKKFATLHEFANHVIKNQKDFEPIVVKRARFYKNIIVKGKGLDMI